MEASKPLTVAELDQLLETFARQREEIEVKKRELSLMNEDHDRLGVKLMTALKETERTSYKSKFGTFIITNKWRVTLPQTSADRDAFFAHLKERGLYENMVTVNSNTLNSFYMQDWEAAKEKGEGMDYKMPGIADPTLHQVPSFRKGA